MLHAGEVLRGLTGILGAGEVLRGLTGMIYRQSKDLRKNKGVRKKKKKGKSLTGKGSTIPFSGIQNVNIFPATGLPIRSALTVCSAIALSTCWGPAAGEISPIMKKGLRSAPTASFPICRRITGGSQENIRRSLRRCGRPLLLLRRIRLREISRLPHRIRLREIS